MSDRALRFALAALALAGASITAYLLWARWSGTELVCSTGGCDTVQNSPYAKVVGIPVPLIGFLGFLAIGATASMSGVGARAAGAALALAAVVFSAYLLVVQLTVIGAVCDWCLASDAVTSLLAVVVLARVWLVPAPQTV